MSISIIPFAAGCFLGAIAGFLFGVALRTDREVEALDQLSRAIIDDDRRKHFSTLAYYDGDKQSEYIVVGRPPQGN